MNTRNNQRYKDNEVRMEAAMLNLMKDYEIDQITVKQLCDKAGVNRSTFYTHFLDVYDMMDKMEKHLNNELLDSYRRIGGNSHTAFTEDSFQIFLTHIKRHQYFYRSVLKSRKNFPLEQGYDQYWNQIIKPYCEKSSITSEDEMMYYFVYFQAGFTMVLRRWVENGCKDSEKQIAKVIKNCVPHIWDKT